LTWTNPSLSVMAIPSAIIAFIVALVLCFKQNWAPALTPAYAALEGCFLGAISLMFEATYPGLVFQAVMLTFGTFFALLMAYKSKLIPVTDKFRMGIVAATGGIFLLYLITWIGSFFGMQSSFLHGSGAFSIGLSVVIVIVAALNLVLDFDFIERGAKSGQMPKYMEWYGAFGLLVTLVWLYVEMLRLLSKLQSRA
ncbi:MAG: Bax inhibitor-1/YccA family protein, partial [Bdellovibrionales bacterium]|nr:Bax inhibitor-1/YccA family protein [Bdellovibrionales bacterium]